jgi:hypothetical protein
MLNMHDNCLFTLRQVAVVYKSDPGTARGMMRAICFKPAAEAPAAAAAGAAAAAAAGRQFNMAKAVKGWGSAHKPLSAEPSAQNPSDIKPGLKACSCSCRILRFLSVTRYV